MAFINNVSCDSAGGTCMYMNMHMYMYVYISYTCTTLRVSQRHIDSVVCVYVTHAAAHKVVCRGSGSLSRCNVGGHQHSLCQLVYDSLR